MTVVVGLCGFSMAQGAYAQSFPVVEIQNTFYDPPTPAVLDRWGRLPVERTIKAWQVVTHTAASPTYRRMKRAPGPDAGAFRDSPTVDDAWRVTAECAARLRATAILFQCPASFSPTSENLRNVRGFFARIVRPAGVQLMLEPRGPAWSAEVGRALCDELGVVHVVDPFVTRPIDRDGDAIRYFRLHGLSGARHVYSDAELGELSGIANACPSARTYVMFNNIPRVSDAKRFLSLRRDRLTG